MNGRAAIASVAMILATAGLLAGVASPAQALVINGDWVISTNVTLKDRSVVISGDITILAGGSLTVDNASLHYRLAAEDGTGIYVEPGGTLRIVNGSTLTSSFNSVAYDLRYVVLVRQGARLVLTNSTIDYAFVFGVGDEDAVLEDSTVSHAFYGLYGSNLTLQRMRFLSNGIGFWLSGHSSVRNTTAAGNAQYGGMLEGDSAVEDSVFSGNEVADLALLDNASARNTTHRFSTRAFIMLQNSSVTDASIRWMLVGGIQVGAEDFGYFCGLLATYFPLWGLDSLNLHLFQDLYRTNNSVRLRDIEIADAARGVWFDLDVWRISNVNKTTYCGDPVVTGPGQPLTNTVNWTITRPTVVEAGANRFNGSLNIAAGGSLTLRGGEMKFESAGATHEILVDGSLTLDRVNLRSAFLDYASNAVNESHEASPDIDIRVRSGGSLTIRDSLLEDLGVSSVPQDDAGIILAEGAQPLLFQGSRVNASSRALTLGCCLGQASASTIVRLEDSALNTTASAMVLRGGNLTLFNTTLNSGPFSSVFAQDGIALLDVYGPSPTLGGPANIQIRHFGIAQARALWQDLRPIPGLEVIVTDFPGGSEVARLTTASDGWAPAVYLPYQITTWSSGGETGPAPALFRFTASRANSTTTTLPVDVAPGAIVTVILRDEVAPRLSIDLPEEYFTNVSGGVVSGTAQDFETGLAIVEQSLDGGPYFNVTDPGAPRFGPQAFAFTLSGLADGIHVVAVRAWDSVGNTVERSIYFIFDRFPPSLIPDFPFDLVTNKRDLNLTGRLVEPGYVTVKGNTTFVPLFNGSFSVPVHIDLDSETVELLVRDLAGNTNTFFVIIRLDDQPPQLTITSPADGAYVTTTTVLISGRKDADSDIYLNGVRLSIATATNFTIAAALTEGQNLLILEAVDRAGNSRKLPLVVYLDSVIPTVQVLSPDNRRPLATADFNLTIRTEAGATVTVGDITFVAAQEIVSFPVHLLEGTTSLLIVARDAAGNTDRRSYTLTIDSRRPLLDIIGGFDLKSENATYRLVGLTEPNARVFVGEYELQADAGGSFAVTVRMHPGANLIPVVVRDSAGNTNSTNVRIVLAQPPPQGDPGFASPASASLTLLAFGVAALALGPLVGRWAGRRRLESER